MAVYRLYSMVELLPGYKHSATIVEDVQWQVLAFEFGMIRLALTIYCAAHFNISTHHWFHYRGCGIAALASP